MQECLASLSAGMLNVKILTLQEYPILSAHPILRIYLLPPSLLDASSMSWITFKYTADFQAVI